MSEMRPCWLECLGHSGLTGGDHAVNIVMFQPVDREFELSRRRSTYPSISLCWMRYTFLKMIYIVVLLIMEVSTPFLLIGPRLIGN